LVPIAGSADSLAAVIDGRAMISRDAGRSWRDGGLGGAGAPVDTLATDTTRPQRLWAAASGQIIFSDDLGSSWHPKGRSLPEKRARVRGITANADATTVVVSSDLGLYRSEDGGQTWVPKEDNLPTHIEAGPLARDPNDEGIIYAVFSLMPYAEVWRLASEGENLLARIEPISLAGGFSFCVLVLIGGSLAARHLSRRRSAGRSPR
jgi:photosystem II stability/assembly factor-like uncharacterized protein